jgi:hypothetical protein
MTRIVTPAPQFTGLSEAEVNAALADPNPGNPIAVEVARLIEGYSENFRAHGRAPWATRPRARLKRLPCVSRPKPFETLSQAMFHKRWVSPGAFRGYVNAITRTFIRKGRDKW